MGGHQGPVGAGAGLVSPIPVMQDSCAVPILPSEMAGASDGVPFSPGGQADLVGAGVPRAPRRKTGQVAPPRMKGRRQVRSLREHGPDSAPVDTSSTVNVDSATRSEVHELTASTSSTRVRRLHLVEDTPWLATQPKFQRDVSDATSQRLAVGLDLEHIWASVHPLCPRSNFGVGPVTRQFGLLFGRRDGAGVLILDACKVFPECFSWNSSSSPSTGSSGGRNAHAAVMMDVVSDLAAELDDALRGFLSESFLPWAREQPPPAGTHRAAWLLCNDGEMFALSAPLLEIGLLTPSDDGVGDDLWRETVVVLDRSRSTANNVLCEVVSLAGNKPQRLLFDVVSGTVL